MILMETKVKIVCVFAMCLIILLMINDEAIKARYARDTTKLDTDVYNIQFVHITNQYAH